MQNEIDELTIRDTIYRRWWKQSNKSKYLFFAIVFINSFLFYFTSYPDAVKAIAIVIPVLGLFFGILWANILCGFYMSEILELWEKGEINDENDF